jgi:5-methylcytosine-specific restriction endonuclease McrBC regulatory subunit McrC
LLRWSRKRCLVRDQNDQSLFHTKPDMHLHCGEDIVVLDTKWKRLDQAQANLGITQTDVYQMHGYEQIYKARSVVLVYPHLPGIRNSGLQGDWHFAVSHVGFKVVTIDLSRPDEFASTIGRLIKAETSPT